MSCSLLQVARMTSLSLQRIVVNTLNMYIGENKFCATINAFLFIFFALLQQSLSQSSPNCPAACKCKSGNSETCRVSSSDCGKPLNSLGYCTYFCSGRGYCGFGNSYQTENSTDCFGCRSNISCDEDYIVSSRSISGYDACRIRANSMPWMVRLSYKKDPNAIQKQYCGGTLISPRLVLTAEHCSENDRWKKLVAIVGDHDILTKDAYEQVVEIVDHIRHPNMGFECRIIQGEDWRDVQAIYRTEEQFSNSLVGITSSNSECAQLVWNQEPKAIGAMRTVGRNNGSCFAFWERRTKNTGNFGT